MYTIRSEAHFDAAHFLAGYDGKCKNIHGHRWMVEATVYALQPLEEGNERGMVSDFSNLRRDLEAIADTFDHSLIYETGTLYPATIDALEAQAFALTEVPYRPTAENLARAFFDALAESGYSVLEVAVYETPGNRASYRED